MRTNFWCLIFHNEASSTTCEVIMSNRPAFWYQALYRLKLTMSKYCAYLESSQLWSMEVKVIFCNRVTNSYRFVSSYVSIKSSCNWSSRIQRFREICYRSILGGNVIMAKVNTHFFNWISCSSEMNSNYLKYESAGSLLDLGSFAIDHITTHAWFLSRWMSCSMDALWFSNSAAVKSLEIKSDSYWNVKQM